jgi:hypothetical protein
MTDERESIWSSNTVRHGLVPLAVGLATMVLCRWIPNSEMITAAAAGAVIAGLYSIGGRSVQAACAKKGFG